MAGPVNFQILLEQVNRIRTALAIGEGKLEALPPGKQGDSDQCVLARALSNGWSAEISDKVYLRHDHKGIDWEACKKALQQAGFKWVELLSGGSDKDSYRYWGAEWQPNEITFEHTKTMCNFIERFDDGDFPDLILKG